MEHAYESHASWEVSSASYSCGEGDGIVAPVHDSAPAQSVAKGVVCGDHGEHFCLRDVLFFVPVE